MTANDDFFTPEEVDQQIETLLQRPDQLDENKQQVADTIFQLRQYYTRDFTEQAPVLERAWERIVEGDRLAKQTSQEKGALILMQEYQEPQTLNSQESGKHVGGKRSLIQWFSILAAVVVAGILVSSMFVVLNTSRQMQGSTLKMKKTTQTGSGGVPLPKPPHPITGGDCVIDTTVTHPQQSRSSVPGVYAFALNIQSNNILYRYNVNTHNIVWSKKFCGAFEAYRIVEQKGVLYLAGTDVTHESTSGMVSYLYALNETDGSVIWGVQFPTSVTPFEKPSPSYGSSALDLGMIEMPTIVNGIAYVAQRTGMVYAFDAVTGRQLWIFNAGRNAWVTTSHGNGPIVDPSSIQIVGGVAYGSIVDRFFALDARSGKLLWVHSFDNNLNINQTPAISNGTIYLTTFVPGYGNVMNPDTYIYAFDAQTGKQKWVTTKMRGYISAPTVLKNKVSVISYDSIWYALNPSSGAIESQKALPNGLGGPGNTFTLNGVLYSTSDTTLAAFNADGSVIWSVAVTGKYPSINWVQSGTIYVSGRGSGIYAYSASDGSLLWHYEGYLPQPDGIVFVNVVD